MTAAEGSQVRQSPAETAGTVAEQIERLNRFQGPPHEFLANLLAVQCRLASAAGAAMLRAGAEGRVEILAVYPPPSGGATPPVWLAQAVESAGQVMPAGATAVKPLHSPDDLYGQPAGRHLVMIPLKGVQGIRGLAVFMVETGEASVLAASRERLELSTSLLSLYEMRLALQRRQADIRRLRAAMEVSAGVGERDRFMDAAMSLCNEVASRWQCDRASLGFLKGRYVRLKAMSHTEKFSRKMKIVQDVESAMEECLDQDIEIVHPPGHEATYVARSAGELSRAHGPAAVCSVPLRKAGEPAAVLTLERPPDRPLDVEEMESLRLTCDLCTPRLVSLYEQDHWFGARAAEAVRKALATALGPKHTWIKLVAVLVFAAVVFVIFAKGDHQAEAPFVLEARQRQVIPAPFDGFLKSVAKEPGEKVAAGDVLAELHDAELRLELASAKADRLRYVKSAATAMRDGKTAEAQMARAEIEKIEARTGLLQHRIGQARVLTPIAGTVVTGELKQRLGAPVKTGEVLFEIAPLDSLRADLSVPEDQVAEVREKMSGELAAAAYPDERVGFVVERINPVAEVAEQRNVYTVRVRLLETRPWMRPGMEGVAKVQIGKRRYIWLFTRRLINWLRMKLWV